ncbi:AAA-ATPase ASD, mitochondrial [Linum grandiflorum]
MINSASFKQELEESIGSGRGFTRMKAGDAFAQLGSIIASLMFLWAMFQQYFPYQLRHNIEKYSQRVFSFVYPYIQITFNEFTGERLMRSELHSAIENYLSSNSSMQAKRLKADILKNNQSLVLSMDDHEEVADEFQGIKMWWASGKNISKSQTLSFYPATDEKRYYKLTFHKRYRNLVIGPYLSHVLKEGRAIKVKNRQRKLYTNNGSHWSHVMFEHPATFDTLGMEAEKKKEILEDLITFSQAEEFYARIGRAWKRGYLLYGPPGTGKSTMIAAIANLLNYDIYDLELTAVKDNTELRKLLIETSSKSVVVIEDIDCSLDLTGQRRKTNEKEEAADEKDPKPKQPKEDREAKPSQVTLSGLLNFIDGLWSACGGERLIVFTTNHVEKLDPALIRKGRMDKHIELSYCSFEAFRVLAKNYLLLHDHQLFDKIRQLLLETKMTPADVAEHLMPKTVPPNPEVCLNSLVEGLEAAQEEAREKNSEKEISAIEETKEENKDATGRDDSKFKQQ